MTASRTRIEIISEILETANGGVTTKLEIMYKANINYVQLKDYLMTLGDKNLLNYDLDTHAFKTTEKGLRFLEIYKKLDNIMKEEEEEQQQCIYEQKQRRSDREMSRLC